MVRENTSTVEVTESYVADVVGENIYFDEKAVAVGGRFDDEERSVEKGLFEAALGIIEVGAESVDLGDIGIERTGESVNYGDQPYGETDIVEVTYDGGFRSTSIGELSLALEKSKDLE